MIAVSCKAGNDLIKEGRWPWEGKKYKDSRDKLFQPHRVVPEMKQKMDMPRSVQVLSPVPLVRDAERPYNNNEDGEGRGEEEGPGELEVVCRGRGEREGGLTGVKDTCLTEG